VYNSMKRTIDANSPIWVPILINVVFILICIALYMYNLPAEDIYAEISGGGRQVLMRSV